MIGYTEVHIGVLERALLAYRSNHMLMESILDECRKEGIRRFDKLPIAKRRKFYSKYLGWLGFKLPTNMDKLRYFDGGYSLSLVDAAFATEWKIVEKVAVGLEHVDDNLLYDWYMNVDRDKYVQLLTLFTNTQGDSLLLSADGCKFIEKWEPKYG